jgi:hypothetical protein
MGFAEEKLAFNARAKASMLEFLRSKTWEEKVESIERMNREDKLAREAMREARRRAAAPQGAHPKALDMPDTTEAGRE